MKANYSILAILFVLSLFSFGTPPQKKKITDVNFRYEFYTSVKAIEPKADRMYYWFKAGAIHNSEDDVTGELLHDVYIKYYLDNQLAEKGSFEYGQKKGSWKTWHQNGMLDTQQYWQEGRRHGNYYSYDTKGNLLEKGNYRKGKKNGRWINYFLKDTVQYKNDLPLIKKVKKTKEERKVAREERKNLRKQKDAEFEARKKARALEKEEKAKKKEQLLLEKQNSVEGDTIKKAGFFKRIFSTKAKKPNGNG